MYFFLAIVGICLIPCVLTVLSQYAVVRAFDQQKALQAKRDALTHTSTYQVWCTAKRQAQQAVRIADGEYREAELGIDLTASYFLMGDGLAGIAQLGLVRSRRVKAQARAEALAHILDCQGTPQRIKDEQLAELDAALAGVERSLARRIRIAMFCEAPFMYRR